jgi:ATP adenylyltransferase
MSQEQLWAPWRLAYIARDSPSKSVDECFICQGLADANDRENYVVLRAAHAVVLLNKYPYNNGHLLVAPQVHKGRLDQLTPEEALDVHQNLARMVRVLEKIMKPDGFNIGANLGKAAGAGLPGHLHWHIVPRYYGDTNFMPVVADTKVIGQALDVLHQQLTAEIAAG